MWSAAHSLSDMRPRVATVLTAQPWEAQFAEMARASGGVRLVCRAYDPGEVPPDVDVIIGGSETAWMTPACIKDWLARGIRVIGIHPPTDRPGRRLFEEAGADAVLSSIERPEVLLAMARSLSTFPSPPAFGSRVTVVSGPAGAPGRTESAVAIACLLSRSTSTLLIDLDHRSPSIALRLGLPPSPNIDEAIDSIRSRGVLPDSAIQEFGDIQVLTGSFRHTLDDARTRRDVLWAARDRADHIIVDGGSPDEGDPLLDVATDTILVCDASPIGLVRAAGLARWWTAPPPAVLLNRTPTDPDDMVRTARHALGLEPQVLVPYQPAIRQASVRAEPPPEVLLEQLAPLVG